MFQEFSDTANPEQGRLRIPLLRDHLKTLGLDGFNHVPRRRVRRGEDMAPYAERLAWLTGFTGSAGSAVILEEPAAIFVDGRYTLQVQDQVDTQFADTCGTSDKVGRTMAIRNAERRRNHRF